ncbi:hypothetical protein AB2D15_23545 [Pseudomonas aeruginosa]
MGSSMEQLEQVDHVKGLFDEVERALSTAWEGIPSSVRASKVEAAMKAARLLGYMDAMEHAGVLPSTLAEQLRPRLNSIVEQGAEAFEELEIERCDLESRLDR